MEIVKKMKIPAGFFYNSVMKSVLFDIREQTGKQLTPEQLNNFSYVKTFSKSSSAKIEIEKVVENEAYHYRTSTTANDYRVQYDIKAIDSENCEVHYTETMESYGFLQKMNDAALGIILGFVKKRNFKKMLTMIEESYPS
ncbi:DUF3284 domain-containing protein [Carnobacterium mobile]|uniref:DUF3284 domain-containing protein n=1 Tax=Carnobacterium mobile TaxID=2750 RepID=UPI0018676898|nr:DUF3284 domain-containing protein [Carnobacterium mobile]